MRRFWKMCGLTALLVGVVLLVAEEGIGQQFPSRPGGAGGQPGGGFGGGGGFGMDPDAMWNAMSKGQDRINLNDPANAWMKGMRERRGQPIPPDGIITRDMFKAEYQQRMAQGGGGFGSGGFGGGKGGRDGGFGGKGGRDGGFGSKGGFGQPPGGTIVIQGGPGGFTQVPAPGGAPGGDTGDFVDGIFKRSDRNGDGKITMDEASDRLRPSFAQYDRNGDGALDLNEFRGYMGDRMSQGGRGGPNGFSGPPGGNNPFQPGSFPPPGNFPSAPPSFDPNQGQGRERGDRKRGGDDEEDARPVVHRYGKLPKELPTWFEKYDTDRDGMVGLYEWRRASEKTDKFVEMDLNGDGYLTADEWLKFSRMQLEKKPGEDDEEGGGPTITRFGPGGSGGSSGSGRPDFTKGGDRGSKGGPPSFGKGEKGGGREKGSKGGEKGNGKRNPFTGG